VSKFIIAVAAVALLAVPAQAKPPAQHPKPDRCAPHKVGFHASGVLVSESLSQTAGAGTATRRDDRYSGTVTVDVKRANHGAPKGTQTYTLSNDRAKFYDRDHNRVADEPKAGDRVKVKGTITRLRRHCDATGFTPTIDVRRVEFRPARTPQS
jgi:hypothetical protein